MQPATNDNRDIKRTQRNGATSLSRAQINDEDKVLLLNERQTLIMRLGGVEDRLIAAGVLDQRSIIPKRKRGI